MTKEQAEIEFKKLSREKIAKEDELIREAVNTGTWSPGLDTNTELLKTINDEFKRKVELLKSMIE